MNNIDEILKDLDKRLSKIENLFSNDGSYNLNVLGNRKAKSINSTVRIKDVKLLFPTISPVDIDKSTVDPSTLVVIPNDEEVIKEIQKAYMHAFEMGKNTGKFPADFSYDDLTANKKESVFLNKNDFINSQKPKVREFLPEFIGNGILMRNVKVGEDEEKNFGVVLRDKSGNLLSPNERIVTGDIGEIVINFHPYNFNNKLGISRYIQGFIRTSSSNNAKSLFI